MPRPVMDLVPPVNPESTPLDSPRTQDESGGTQLPGGSNGHATSSNGHATRFKSKNASAPNATAAVSVSSDEDEEAPELPWSCFLAKRWLLRSWHSLVGAVLFVLAILVAGLVATWVPVIWTSICGKLQAESLPVHKAPSVNLAQPSPLLHLLILLALALPFMPLYHLLSRNGAGGYYDTFSEMFTKLPQHFQNIARRHGEDYAASIQTEHQRIVFRTVNGLESGVIFVVVGFVMAPYMKFSMLAPFMKASAAGPWLTKAAVFFLLHRTYGANLLEGDCMGLFQPEGMWRLRCKAGEDTNDAHSYTLEPLLHCPEQSY